MEDIVKIFLEAVDANMAEGESKEAFMGFARDAETDQDKRDALTLWCENFQGPDGKFSPDMFDHEGFELFDFFEDYMETK